MLQVKEFIDDLEREELPADSPTAKRRNRLFRSVGIEPDEIEPTPQRTAEEKLNSFLSDSKLTEFSYVDVKYSTTEINGKVVSSILLIYKV